MTSLKIWLVIFRLLPHLQLYLQLYLLERPLVFYLQNYAHGCFTLFGFTDIKVSQIVVPRNFRSSFSKLNDIRKVRKYPISTPLWTRNMKKLIIVIMILFGKDVR